MQSTSGLQGPQFGSMTESYQTIGNLVVIVLQFLTRELRRPNPVGRQCLRLKRLKQEVPVLQSSNYSPAGLLQHGICTCLPVTAHHRRPSSSFLQMDLEIIWIINLPTPCNIFSLCLNGKQTFFSDGFTVLYSLEVFLDWTVSTL